MAVYKDEKRKTWYFKGKIKVGDKYKDYQKRGFATKKEAVQAEFVFKENYKGETVTLNKVAEEYLIYIENKKSKGTVQAVKQRYENRIQSKLGDKDFLSIKTKDIIDLQSELAKEYKNSYVNLLIVQLGTMFNFANKVLDLENNAVKKVDKLPESRLDKIGKVWTVEEFAEFYAVIEDQFWQCLFYTLYFTGMRRGELLGLTWNDFDGDVLDVNKSYSKTGLGKPKTENSIRKIKLNTTNIELLNEHKINMKKNEGFRNDWYIFGKEKPISFNMLDRTKDKYVEESGVERIRIHDFRHSHASFLINNKIPLPAIASRLGDTINTVLDTYSHLFDESMAEVVDLIESTKKVL